MKPFFTLIIGKMRKESEDKYLCANSIDPVNIQKFQHKIASLYYQKPENIAANADIFEINLQTGNVFFGFGTFISNNYGILGKNFIPICEKIYNSGIPFKEEFVNGIYTGIEFHDEKISLFNDFFGLATIFYYQNSEGLLIVSNSFEQLFKFVATQKEYEWNYSALSEYLSFGKTLSGETLIKNINILLPAREITISDEISISCYRNFPPESSVDVSFNNLVGISQNLVNNAVSRMHSPDYSYSLSLSGGIDSRIVFFEWPDRNSLLTETYGDEANSDTIKAMELVNRYGNIELHKMEQGYPEKYHDGLFDYLDNIDYPLMAGYDNLYHLNWKLSRNAEIRFGGTDGELLGGENLYLSRKPTYVFKEGFCSYPYKKLQKNDSRSRENLLSLILYRSSKKSISSLLGEKFQLNINSIIDEWEDYLGECKSMEVYSERFRTYHTVVEHNYHFQNYFVNKATQLTPFQDYNITKYISTTRPKLRELRKLELALLKKYPMGKEIPVDTTHLKVDRPYWMHKFFRMLRFVINIGFSREVPLIQIGTTLKTTIPAFYLPENEELREKVITKIRKLTLLDKEKLNSYLSGFDSIKSYNHFKATHEGWPNLFILLRLAIFEERISKLKNELKN